MSLGKKTVMSAPESPAAGGGAAPAVRRIYILDDHPMLRDGLARALGRQPGWELCGEASTAAVAFREIPELRPDLAIIDISLPDKNGLELIKDLRALMGKLRILVLSMHDEMVYAERVMRAGAQGYVMKGSASDSVVEAAARVMDGGNYLSQRVTARILSNLSGSQQQASASHEKLTDRELEVFELIGLGGTNHEIAAQLNISAKTVDAHRFNIRGKLGLRDAPALLREAVLWVELTRGNPPS